MALMLVTSMFGCKEYLDVNTDPNNPTDVGVEFILPAAQSSVAVTMGGTFQNLGGFWSQYYTQSTTASQYKTMDAYNLTTDEFDREYTSAYAGGLNDLEVIRQKATADGDNGYYLIATLLQCYEYQMIADIYDNIGFSEALKGESDGIYSPKLDNGSDVYPVLLDRIDEAVARYQDGSLGKDPSDRDIVYGGDMAQWVAFGNTLKLKLYMRMSYTSMANPGAVQALLAEGNFITADATMIQFADEIGKQNPMYGVDKEFHSDVNQRASNTLMNYLVDNNDPRLDVVYTVPGAGIHKGNIQGDYDNLDIKGTDLSTINYGPSTPVYFISVAEKDFLVSEAELRYGSAGNAQASYEAGIESSFSMHGLSGASALYGSGGPYEYDLSLNTESQLGQIMMQKWVALANVSNLEAFFETNRTHYPPVSNKPQGEEGDIGELTISFASVLPEGQTPKRLFIPDVVVSRNSSNITQAPNLYKKVWWDKK